LLKNLLSGSRNQTAENELNARIFSGKNHNGALSLREQFEIDIAELGDRVHELGLEELEVRENEIKVFEESLEIARCQFYQP
jgi:hypothetical protein